MSTTATARQALEHQNSHVCTDQLEHLVMHDLPRFYRQAHRQLDNAHDAEDAVQDALVSAYKNLSQFRGTAQLSTWFMTIVMNAARMQRRRRRPVVSFEEQLTSNESGMTLLETYRDIHPDPEEILAKSELRHLLAKAINRLSPVCRRAIRLHYMEDMTAAEAAEALGVPVGTIKAQLSRARSKLAKLLRREVGPNTLSPRANKAHITQ
jgi:RNA polymerase sigma-70 factor (ECF subfamily)